MAWWIDITTVKQIKYRQTDHYTEAVSRNALQDLGVAGHTRISLNHDFHTQVETFLSLREQTPFSDIVSRMTQEPIRASVLACWGVSTVKLFTTLPSTAKTHGLNSKFYIVTLETVSYTATV